MPLLPSRGRPGQILLMSVERELTSGDLIRLATEPRATVGAPIIQRLSASHHAAARALAGGKSVEETALAVGRTPQRIGDLTRDPAFQNLLAYYEDQVAETGIADAERIQGKLTDVGEIALDEIRERLEEPDEIKKIPVSELRQIAAFGLDRTVAPPRTAVSAPQAPVKVTFNMGPREIKPRTPDPKTIDVEAEKE